ncbi:MAG: hypothetical protein HGB21_16555 [Nitrospirae bacterium]|nr:hypothetical protein [Nitrospirota bacterium]
MKRLFFSQSMLDSMMEAGKIKVDKGILTMLAGDNPNFSLHPAFRIVRTIDDGADPNGLVGQIRSEAELRELGAETYMDSVIYRDIAYQADTGFIAEKQVPMQATDAKTAPKTGEQSAAVAEPPADKSKDANDLSKFILDNLL